LGVSVIPEALKCYEPLGSTPTERRGYIVGTIRMSLAFEAVAEGDGFEFHADGVHDGDDGAGFEYERREG